MRHAERAKNIRKKIRLSVSDQEFGHKENCIFDEDEDRGREYGGGRNEKVEEGKSNPRKYERKHGKSGRK